ncbi:MAG: DUF2202 domain-containing protein [Streptomycetaceae bacterium]|nr:MAG: DUF2202 domain-containing protein [Streptomycetaceae bacterium]
MRNIKKIQAFIAVVALSMMVIAPSASAATRPTTNQKLQLQYVVEEEKLARDVYLYLSANVTSRKFSNIARAEQTHKDDISLLLKTYGITDPTLTRATGVFKNTTLQSLYKTLTAQGSTDILAAYGVGTTIEKLDIGDLQKDLKYSMPADMKLALNRLLSGSQKHLAAFSI